MNYVVVKKTNKDLCEVVYGPTTKRDCERYLTKEKRTAIAPDGYHTSEAVYNIKKIEPDREYLKHRLKILQEIVDRCVYRKYNSHKDNNCHIVMFHDMQEGVLIDLDTELVFRIIVKNDKAQLIMLVETFKI